jgi:two-component sensor histidine kinase
MLTAEGAFGMPTSFLALQHEADALRNLADCSSRLWRAQTLAEGLQEIVRASMRLLGASKGNIQLIDPSSNKLVIAAQVGFEQPFLDFFREVSMADPSACGRALGERVRVAIADVETDEGFAPLRAVAREAGFRAVQSTPLLKSGGSPLGILSTHFAQAHTIPESDLALLDLYCQQAVAFIDRMRMEDRLRFLNLEVSHRSKNLLALVGVIARRTAANGANDFHKRFEQRIQSLASSHDLLAQANWSGVDMFDIARSQIGHVLSDDGNRLLLKGMPLVVAPVAVQPLAMAIHELVTNAAKHGALAGEEGRVELRWAIETRGAADRRFVMEWQELDGPAIAEPSRQGFGTTLITRIVEHALNGKVELSFPPTGLLWRLRCELGSITGSDFLAAGAARSGAHPAYGKHRVLVVEDEALVALELETVIQDAGYEVLGPVGSVAGARDLLACQTCDAAILDINLGNESSEPIARQLSALGVPFVTVSGYSVGQRSAVFEGAPFIAKPAQPEILISHLRHLIDG